MFEITLHIRCGRDAGAPASMSDWIDQAKKRENDARAESDARERARVAVVERLTIAFPAWQSLLFRALEKACKKLADAFPGDFTRHYSVNQQPGGYFLRCQGMPENNLELRFFVPTQTMTAKRLTKEHQHDEERDTYQNNGAIKITTESQVFIEYNPILRDGDGMSRVRNKYSDPEVLADDLLRELTGL
jgi:hypothetical protein